MSIMIIIAIIVATILIILSYTISHKSNYPITFTGVNDITESKSQYECGLEPIEELIGKETRERFYLKFYIIGILFLIFDLETLLLFPGALIFYNINSIMGISADKSFIVLLIFIFLLLLGLIYEYRKNVL